MLVNLVQTHSPQMKVQLNLKLFFSYSKYKLFCLKSVANFGIKIVLKKKLTGLYAFQRKLYYYLLFKSILINYLHIVFRI
ncbi:hypothetical protein CCAND95_90014 [Capnocytophaga canis]|uniref:Uncharacterized protein n=1 Tax=Capnocytophaga canis TaxID=1848903 RepID=A0A0B7IL23_9FLAO|nr:hypothetical protein CCAND38_30023 [Capnocytophaga canis]CEN47271.1 hypothetical protein CCAND95_90014 [Capnocytophaga canis]CEN52611.1 hypothetical protein CCAND93_270013 [Capnocytophaga canis]